jgi:hypothetical protein
MSAPAVILSLLFGTALVMTIAMGISCTAAGCSS